MKKAYLKRIALAAVALATAVTPFVAPQVQSVRADNVIHFTIEGSTQMYTLGALLANRYQQIYPNIHIQVVPTSSQQGFSDSCTGGQTAVGMSDNYILDGQLTVAECGDMVGVPVAVSATPVIYNLPGATLTALNKSIADGFTLQNPVRLDRTALADIYTCAITKWNDPKIQALNPSIKLPSQNILSFATSEGGGSGFIFAQWLSLANQDFYRLVGNSLTPAWQRCTTGVSSSGQMVQAIKNTPYSIGFAGFDYAIANHMQAAALKNTAGKYLTPSLNGMAIAIKQALIQGMPGDFRKTFVDAPGDTAFNPADFEFFTVHRDLRTVFLDASFRKAVKDFLTWCISLKGGQAFIEQIELRRVNGHGTLQHGYIPVPVQVVDTVSKTVSQIAI